MYVIPVVDDQGPLFALSFFSSISILSHNDTRYPSNAHTSQYLKKAVKNDFSGEKYVSIRGSNKFSEATALFQTT